MAIKVRLEKSKFKEANRAGKWYLRTVNMGDVNTNELATKIQQKSTFTKADVHGLIVALVEEMRDQLQMGKTVVLDGVGRFRLSVESEAVENEQDFHLGRNVKSVRCNFIPAGKRPMGGKKTDSLADGVKVEWYEEK